MNEQDYLMEIRNLSIYYTTQEGVVRAVEEMELTLRKGETLGLVGETGAGKTTTALGIMQLVPNPPGKIVSGTILFDGEDLLAKSQSELRKIRGNKISMIFQDPMTSLNPVMTIGDQITEVIKLHSRLNPKEAEQLAGEMLRKVGIPGERAKDYPHQFSGGMRQRVGIAIALACNPVLLIADEPTTALDVTIQAQVLKLMKQLKDELETAMIMITHDLGIVAEVCDKVAIMYAGNVVEYTDKERLYTTPKHPYTIGLFASIPDIDLDEEQLKPIKGLMPDPIQIPQGCAFHPRCPRAFALCNEVKPRNREIEPGHFVKCLLFE